MRRAALLPALSQITCFSRAGVSVGAGRPRSAKQPRTAALGPGVRPPRCPARPGRSVGTAGSGRPHRAVWAERYCHLCKHPRPPARAALRFQSPFCILKAENCFRLKVRHGTVRGAGPLFPSARTDCGAADPCPNLQPLVMNEREWGRSASRVPFSPQFELFSPTDGESFA